MLQKVYFSRLIYTSLRRINKVSCINREKYILRVTKSFEQLKNKKNGPIPYLALEPNQPQKPNPYRETVPANKKSCVKIAEIFAEESSRLPDPIF